MIRNICFKVVLTILPALHIFLCIIAGVADVEAKYKVNTDAALLFTGSTGDFAPSYFSANRHGVLTQGDNVLLRVGVSDSLDLKKRFDFSYGLEAYAGWGSEVAYGRWDESEKTMLYNNRQQPAPIWLQQIYAEVKWRCLYLSVGMKNRGSSLVDDTLSSGDLVWSGNARSIPEVRVGFVEFQNIPFTKGWLQIDLALSYGSFFDKRWEEHHFSYNSGHINTGTLWTYKRLYLRTNPNARFYAKFGFQMSGLFGGKTYYYSNGKLTRENDNYDGLKDWFAMLIPVNGDKEGYKTGDHKGSWDISFQYRFRDESTLRAYTQMFWEDGTGMSKHNGLDALWGLEYHRTPGSWFSGAVVEYLDFTNQSGPIQYSPKDDPSSKLKPTTTGRDDYYNNYFYRPYVNNGVTIGTPMVMGIVYNLNGMSSLLYNRVRAIHIAAEGSLSDNIGYVVKYSHRKAWGQPFSMQLLHPGHSDSWSIGINWSIPFLSGLSLRGELGGDHGNLPANTFGVLVGLDYDMSGIF